MDDDNFMRALAVGTGLFLALYLVRWASCKYLCRLTRRTLNGWDDLVVSVIGRFSGVFFLAVAIHAGWEVGGDMPPALRSVAVVVYFLQAARLLGTLITELFKRRLDKLKNQNQRNILELLSLGARFVAYIGVFLTCLDTLGVDVTAAVAGLGIGGIAVALAVQNTLTDLLSSLSIILDRPFEVGDFIVSDDFQGTVDRIGIKSTRATSLTGEQIVFPNSQLLQSRLRNYKRMRERRVALTLKLERSMPLESAPAVPEMIKRAVESTPRTRFERAHFVGPGDWSWNFELVYWVTTAEYNDHMDAQQSIMLKLTTDLARAGLAFAVPLQHTELFSPDGSLALRPNGVPQRSESAGWSPSNGHPSSA